MTAARARASNYILLFHFHDSYRLWRATRCGCTIAFSSYLLSATLPNKTANLLPHDIVGVCNAWNDAKEIYHPHWLEWKKKIGITVRLQLYSIIFNVLYIDDEIRVRRTAPLASLKSTFCVRQRVPKYAGNRYSCVSRFNPPLLPNFIVLVEYILFASNERRTTFPIESSTNFSHFLRFGTRHARTHKAHICMYYGPVCMDY